MPGQAAVPVRHEEETHSRKTSADRLRRLFLVCRQYLLLEVLQLLEPRRTGDE